MRTLTSWLTWSTSLRDNGRTAMCAVACVLCCAFAFASGARAVEDDLDQAKKYFQLGTMHYDLGEYDKALVAFEKARSLKPLPGFLFNIGQCQRRMNNHEAALASFEQYLKEAPNAPNKKDVQKLIEEEKKLRDDASAARATAPPPTSAPVAIPPKSAAVESSTTPPVTTASDAAADEGDNSMLVWAAVGGGAVLLLAGGAATAAVFLIPAPPKASLGRVDLRGAP